MKCMCCSGKDFAGCCEPLLKGEPAPSAEALMRSRYSAYARRDFDYVLNTTDPQRRYDFDHEASRDWMDNSQFTKLEVLRASEEGNKGTVEFIAHFKRGDTEESHHEISKFRKQGGVWYFREGKVVPPPAGK